MAALETRGNQYKACTRQERNLPYGSHRVFRDKREKGLVLINTLRGSVPVIQSDNLPWYGGPDHGIQG